MIITLKEILLTPLLLLFVTVVVFLLGSGRAYADGEITFSVNGGATAGVVNGLPVDLEWFIDPSVYTPSMTCTIEESNEANGIIINSWTISGADLPLGNLTVVPPNTAVTRYRMSCAGYEQIARVIIAPEIILSFDSAWRTHPLTVVPVQMDYTDSGDSNEVWGYGNLYRQVRYATACDSSYHVAYENGETPPGFAYSPFSWAAGSIPIAGSGRSGFWGTPPFLGGPGTIDSFKINSTSTLTLTCRNQSAGLESSTSIVIPARLPVGPPPVSIVDPLAVTFNAVGQPGNVVTATYDADTGIGSIRVVAEKTSANFCRGVTYSHDGPAAPVAFGALGGAQLFSERYIGHGAPITLTVGVTGNATIGVECTDGVSTATATLQVQYSGPTDIYPVSLEIIAATTTVPVTNFNSINGQAVFNLVTTGLSHCELSGMSFVWVDNFVSSVFWNDVPISVQNTETLRPLLTTDSTTVSITCHSPTLETITETITFNLADYSDIPDPELTITNIPEVVFPNPETGLATVNFDWESNYVASCLGEGRNVGSTPYPLNLHGIRSGYVDIGVIATTTEFTIRCNRRDGASVEERRTVAYYVSEAEMLLAAEADVETGECIDELRLITGSDGGPVSPIPPGYTSENGVCIVNPADVFISSRGVSEQSTWTPNHETGSYDDVELRMVFTNNGPGTLSTGIPYRFDIQFNNTDRTNFNPDSTWIATSTAELMTVGMNSPILRVFGGVPFGTHLLRVRINQDPLTLFEGNTAEVVNNNTAFYEFFVPPPEIPMVLSTARQAIRRGQVANLDWTVESGYPVSCAVYGPGINEEFSLTPTPGFPISVSNTAVSAPLNNTTEFTLTCTEPLTNTIFIERQRLEIVSEPIEI